MTASPSNDFISRLMTTVTENKKDTCEIQVRSKNNDLYDVVLLDDSQTPVEVFTFVDEEHVNRLVDRLSREHAVTRLSFLSSDDSEAGSFDL